MFGQTKREIRFAIKEYIVMDAMCAQYKASDINAKLALIMISAIVAFRGGMSYMMNIIRFWSYH